MLGPWLAHARRVTRSRARGLSFLATFCLVALGAPNASAQTRALRWDPPVDYTVTLGGGALWIASVALGSVLDPSSCRWCATNPVDAGARRALLWPDADLAGQLSDATGFVLSPAAAYGLGASAAFHAHASSNFALDALLITEATVLALDLDEATKLLTARSRPYVRADGGPRDPDDLMSFFSGHATETFALAASSGTVAMLRGYAWAPAPWIAGGILAVTTGYLRIAADRHWLTDVLVGMIAGTCVGVAVPLLFHGPQEN